MELTIQASPRNALGKQNKKLRRQGKLPAVVYGKGKDTQVLEIGTKQFEKVFKQTGENTLINLKIEGLGTKKVLIHDVAKNFMRNDPIHVDFYEVDLTRKIHAEVPLHFVGVSPAVKESGGILVRNLKELKIEALPTDLPVFIEVDLERLKAFGDLFRIRDLPVSDKVKVLDNLETVVVTVQEPRSEEELAELEKPTAEEEKAAIEGMAKEEEKPTAEGEETADKAEEKSKETKKEEK